MEPLTSVDIIKTNNIVFHEMREKIHVKRVMNECSKLYTLFPNVVATLISGQLNLVITEFINGIPQLYKFVFRDGYPFKPPIVFYNNTLYSDILKISKYEIPIVKKLRGNGCLCCYSINCRDNWSPSITLLSFINEIKETFEFKKTIEKILLVEKIEEKHHIPDANISSYLM